MKKKSMIRAACTFLLVAVLAAMAFIRGPEQFWVLAGVFAIWGIWMLVVGLSSPMVQSRRSAGRLKRKRAAGLRQMIPAPASPKEDTDEPIPSAGQVMLLHVGHRISAYLKSAYPDAAWEWCGKASERAIIEGGVLRIRIFNVPDYNYAEVHFDQHANLCCDMLRVVPLAKAGKEDAPAPAPQPSDQQPLQAVDGTIVECNTAYGGSRVNTAMHYQVAEDHGFTAIAPVQILDEDGSMSIPVEGGAVLTENYVGRAFADYDSYLVLSHFKGHSMAGFGGAIKNISIGLGSRSYQLVLLEA